MNFEFKHVLGKEYYLVEGWEIRKKIIPTGVSFRNERVYYTSNRHILGTPEEDLALTLDEAKKKCLEAIDEYCKCSKEQVLDITESMINLK